MRERKEAGFWKLASLPQTGQASTLTDLGISVCLTGATGTDACLNRPLVHVRVPTWESPVVP